MNISSGTLKEASKAAPSNSAYLYASTHNTPMMHGHGLSRVNFPYPFQFTMLQTYYSCFYLCIIESVHHQALPALRKSSISNFLMT